MAGSGLAESVQLSVILIDGPTLRPEAVDGFAPVGPGPAILILPGASGTSAQIVTGLSVSAEQGITMSPRVADEANGRLGIVMATHDTENVVSFPSIDTVEFDLTGDGISDMISLCLTGSAAHLTATAGDTGAELFRHSVSLGYSVVPTCETQ